MIEIERAIEKKEYIERGAFLNWLNKRMDEVGTDKESRFYVNQTMTILESYPAADVEPVVRARWQDGKCTNCDCFGFPRYDGGNEYTIRCPNCGAHMMERSEHED